MDFGILIPPVADSWKTVKRASQRMGRSVFGHLMARSLRPWFPQSAVVNHNIGKPFQSPTTGTSRCAS